MPALGTEVIWSARQGRGLTKDSGFFRMDVFFYGHVFELAGIEDIATFLAFDKFRIFLARYNPHTGMPTQFLHILGFGSLIRDW